MAFEISGMFGRLRGHYSNLRAAGSRRRARIKRCAAHLAAGNYRKVAQSPILFPRRPARAATTPGMAFGPGFFLAANVHHSAVLILC